MEMAIEDKLMFTLSLAALQTDSQSIGVPQMCFYANLKPYDSDSLECCHSMPTSRLAFSKVSQMPRFDIWL